MLQDLVKAFTPEVLNFVVTVVFTVALVLIGLFLSAVRKTEWFKQNELVLTAIAQKALELILHTEYGTEYDSAAEEYQTKADQRVKDGLYYVDPRMLFVIDKLQDYVNRTFNVSLSFDDLLLIAENKYQTTKHDDSNSLLAPKP